MSTKDDKLRQLLGEMQRLLDEPEPRPAVPQLPPVERALREAGRPLTLTELGARIGVARTNVWRHLLRDLGARVRVTRRAQCVYVQLADEAARQGQARLGLGASLQ
jgi:hypothetical protein